MEPIPESLEALQELAKYGDPTLLETVRRISADAGRIVPDLVGLSFAVVGEDLTFTLVASDPAVADLDAVQYLDDGPCVHATGQGTVTTYRSGDPLDEATWSAFARATSAKGVASTLSLPMVREGLVVAGVNLYASTVDAFEGHHHALAEACSAWEPGIVADADLEFQTRAEAVKAPGVLHDEDAVNTAIGVIAAAQRIDTDEATRRLEQAAARANISLARAARAVMPVFTSTE
jgi:hypothetical protein